MCLADIIPYICTVCNTRAGKPRGPVIQKCPAASASGPHCGHLRNPAPTPSETDPALNPSGLEFETLLVAPGYTHIDPAHRRPKPKPYICELCLDYHGPDEARAMSMWWQKEQKSVLKQKRVTPGPSTAGWCDILRK